VRNEELGIGALLFPIALCEATNLFGIRGLSEWAFTAQTQLLILSNSASVRVDGIT
jgi:hypothetical protein